jgi:hypothetical protein
MFSPDLAFILTLALRMAITAAFVVSASVITERSGPVIGALVATLPISAGPSYVFLALDHDAAFIAEGALASLPINAATIWLALTYVVLAQRRNALVSCGGAIAVWLALAALMRTVHWSLAGGLIVNAITFAISLPLLRRFRHVKMPLITRRWYDIPLRASLVATLVATVVTLGWAWHQRRDCAVPGGLQLHDAGPASAHRRQADRGRDCQWRLGSDGFRHRDRCPERCGAAVRLRGRAQPRAGDVHELEPRAVVERAAKGCND